jgi:magnesium transporter
LIGSITLLRLILSRTSVRVEDVMDPSPISVRVDEDQEEVARKIQQYDLIAIPVLDGEDRLVGIVTHDDAMDILRQEQTEDMLRFGGVAPDPEAEEGGYWKTRITHSVQRRIGWLLLLFLASTLTSQVSQYFRGVQLHLPDLADFVPLLIGTGGNAGSQTVGTIIRGLALGEIETRDGGRVLLREGFAGTLMGLMLGALGFLYTWILHGNPAFASVIGLAILFICIWANSVGAIVPVLARRAGIDPAVVSAPLISTLVDATGLVIYYTTAILILMRWAG